MGGGGGGGGSDVDMRDPKTEKKTIGNWYDFQQNQFGDFVGNNPLLNAAQGGALDFWKQLPGMLSQFPGFQNEITGAQNDIKGYQGQLQDVYGGIGGLLSQLPGLQNQQQGFLSQIPGLQNQFQQGFGGLLGQLPGLSNQLGGYSDLLGNLSTRTGALGSPFEKFLGHNSALNNAYADNAQTLRNEGALSKEGLRSATQLSRSLGPSGASRDPAAIAVSYTHLTLPTILRV